MLQNAAIDVTIALILMYLMLSLLCTVIMDLDAGRVDGAIAFNVDSFNVAVRLWSDQDRPASIVASATQMSQEPLPGVPEGVDNAKLGEVFNKTEDMLRSLPIGWNCWRNSAAGTLPADQKPMTLDSWECVKKNRTSLTRMQVFGWIFTATALTLGAPFWFGLLQKCVNVRGAGGRPKREDEKAE